MSTPAIIRQLADPNINLLDDPAALQVIDVAAKEKRRGPPKPKRRKKGPYSRKNDEYLPFQPKFDLDHPCCQKRCWLLWVDRVPEIEAFRAAIVPSMKPAEKREVYWAHQATLGGGVAACNSWLKCVYGLRSNDKLYGPRASGVKKDAKSAKLVGMLAWFQTLLETADKMPDTPDYIIPAPSRHAVYQWYPTDVEEHPDLYPFVHKIYFNRAWNAYYPNVKLRKYLRACAFDGGA